MWWEMCIIRRFVESLDLKFTLFYGLCFSMIAYLFIPTGRCDVDNIA